MTRRTMTQAISKEVASDQRSLEERVAHWERAMVGQLARETHEAGEEFAHWPVADVIEDDLFPHKLALEVRVETVPR